MTGGFLFLFRVHLKTERVVHGKLGRAKRADEQINGQMNKLSTIINVIITCASNDKVVIKYNDK